MSDQTQFSLDKNLVRQSFDRAAETYDQAAVLQREVAQNLIERLEFIKIEPQKILDVGAGTGHLTSLLNQRYKKTEVIALDLAHNMLMQAKTHSSFITGLFKKRRYICGDAEYLPLNENGIDMIISNLTLQWCNNLEQAFSEFYRVLKPGGLLLFTTFGPDTLRELRQSWKTVDSHIHVNAFIDMHDIGDALLRCHFNDPVLDVENITVTYKDTYKLMRDLKSLGAHNVTSGRSHGLTGKGPIKKMIEQYENFRKDGLLPASHEVVHGHAWVPDNKSPIDKNTFTFPMKDIGRIPGK
ncbi:MAG: malonyl-ACP O-methyltransferase BioC [Gammaproteobacteria bacterium]